MAARIKGITIEINGDSTKLTKALADVDHALKTTQSNLRDLNRALKLDPGNSALLKDKQVELANAIDATKEKLEKEKEALEQMKNTQGFDANSEAARNLQTQIDLDTAALKELEAQARQSASVLGTQMQVAGQKIQEVGEKIKSVGDKIAGIGQTMTTYVTGPIVGAFGASAKAAIDWESAFTGVMKTVDETANTTYDDLKKSINEIAKTTASSQNEIAATMEIAGQLGVSADDITEFTKVMVMLGDTTNLSSEEAASSIARFANVTGMSLKDVDKLGSAIVDLGNNYATTEADIMSMAQRLSGAGAQIGLSQGEILGFATALSSVGIEAEMGGSAFSKAMIKMQVAAETGYDQVIDLQNKTGMSLRELQLLSSNNSKDFKALADSLGLTKEEMNATIKAGANLQDFAEVANMETKEFVELYRNDAPAALQAFIKGLGDTEGHGESTIAMLQEMGFTEVRLRDTLTRLANSGDLVTDAVARGNQAWGENSAMTAEAEKRYATMAAKISQLKARITEVAVEIGEMLMPYLEKGMNKIEEWVAAWKNLSDEQKENILKMAAFAAAIGPVLLVVGKLIASIGSIVTVGGKLVGGIGKLLTLVKGVSSAGSLLSTIFTALGGPIGIVVAAIAALAAGFAYLYSTNEEFRASIQQVVTTLQTNLAGALERIKPALASLKEAFDGLMTMLAPVFELIFRFIAGVVNGIASAVGPIIETITNIISFITNIIQAFIALINGDFEGCFNYLSEAFNNWVMGMLSFIEIFIQMVLGFFEMFGVNLQASFTTMWTNVKTTVSEALAFLKLAITTTWNYIKTWLSTTLTNIKTKFEEIFDKIKTAITERIEGAKNAIIEGMEAAADYIKSLPQKFYDWGKDMVQNLIDGIQAKIDALRAKISELAGMVASYIHFSEPDVGPLSDFHTYMPDMIDELVNGINQGIPRVAQAMNGLTQNMVPQVNSQGMANNSTNTFNINVYGAQGQNVSELADVIEQRITENVMRRGVAFG
jgi:TP901 family phage tail tape measure protein